MLNLWFIRFLKKLRVVFSSSIVSNFQKTKLSMTDSIFNKVGSCYFTKYKLNRRCFMSKFSEILIVVYRKIYSGFYPNLHETNLVAPVSLLSYVFETLNFIPYGFDSHFRNFFCIPITSVHSLVAFSYYYSYIRISQLNHTISNP